MQDSSTPFTDTQPQGKAESKHERRYFCGVTGCSKKFESRDDLKAHEAAHYIEARQEASRFVPTSGPSNDGETGTNRLVPNTSVSGAYVREFLPFTIRRCRRRTQKDTFITT
jgi:hypothetical protein